MPRRSSLRIFLCLAQEQPSVLAKRALHLYLLKRTFDACRHGRKKYELVYWAELLTFLSRFPNYVTDYRTSITDDLYGALM